MLAASETITETIKQVIQSLQIRFLFPAIVFVMVNVFLFPDLGIGIKLESNMLITFSVMSIILLSYLFAAFNGLIIRLAEGYELNGNWNLIYLAGKFYQQYNCDKLKAKIEKHVEFINEIGSLSNALYLDDSLTDDESRVVRFEINKIKEAVQMEIDDLKTSKNRRFQRV